MKCVDVINSLALQGGELTLLSVTVKTEGSCVRGPWVAVLRGEGRAEPECLWCFCPDESAGVLTFSAPAPALKTSKPAL